MRSLAGSFRLMSSSTKSISVMTISADQHRDDEHRQDAVHFQPAEHQEQQRIEHIAHAVQLQLVALRGPPGEPLGQFMVIERVERAHRDLNGDQGPEQRRIMTRPPGTRRTGE